TLVESTPPLRNVTTGTSEVSRNLTPSRNSSRTRLTASWYVPRRIEASAWAAAANSVRQNRPARRLVGDHCSHDPAGPSVTPALIVYGSRTAPNRRYDAIP